MVVVVRAISEALLRFVVRLAVWLLFPGVNSESNEVSVHSNAELQESSERRGLAVADGCS